MPYSDLHRHDERSLFDGFGKPQELVKIAKKLGYPALGITNHGDMSSLVSHYFACKDAGLIPVMGCEGYFVPKYNPDSKSRGYHLNLWIKNLKGYQNLNKLMTYASKHQFYYRPLWSFDLLQKYHEGLMCGSACIGGPLSQLLVNGKEGIAYKVAGKFKELFGDDFYIEIMPYALSEKSLQEKCNKMLMKLAKDLDIKCIFTSDSHFGSKEDFDTYLKMHEIAGHLELGKEYSERYMPSEEEIINRFVKMHGGDFSDTKTEAKRFAKQCISNIDDLVSKVETEILEKLKLVMPKIDEEEDSSELLWNNIVKGLKEKDKWTKKYKERVKEEYEVICYHGFEDYFLMVQDYVLWAKKQGIEVGPGRGSVCNCLVAYALDITEVDSLLFDLDFRRFLRKDKKKLPDVDMDFETEYRGQVIDYLIGKYKGHAARICSYGLYKLDNCLNDLFKVCGLKLPSKKDENYSDDSYNEILSKQKEIKKTVDKYIELESGDFDYEAASKDQKIKEYNEKYDNVIKHFNKLYKKVRFYGTHAAGVAITGAALSKYTAIERRAQNAYTTSYDLIDIEQINGIKFDMLGLRTMSILRELRDLCGRPHHFCEEYLYDSDVYEIFRNGDTDGIFQFESMGGKGILKEIDASDYKDVIAASALNRPGPLGLGMHTQYANAKNGIADETNESEVKDVFDKYASDSYGCFVYQEQVMKICHYAAGMEWSDADKIMKMMKSNKTMSEKALKAYNEEHDRLEQLFVTGAMSNGYSKKVAKQIFDKLNVYTFNKGHAVGYALISIEQAWYKVHYPIQFWYITLKYAKDEDYWKLASKAAKSGCVILLPHVNGTAQHSLRTVDNELAIQEGMKLVKNVGLKAAEFIEEEVEDGGPFRNIKDFELRMEPYKRVVNKRVIDALQEAGALEFDEKKYYRRVISYNSSMYSK